MRITQEADDAVRIIDCLVARDKRLDARTISDTTGVTLRFTLKILRKLVKNGIVKSFLGASGGYELAKKPEKINLREVIEAVDGPIAINRCLSGNMPCGLAEAECSCYYHQIFANISKTIQEQLESVSFEKSIRNSR
ncbi:MAG: Rrf2 family transcriptional regulator [Clostridiales bacterium]|nr:Rrf2 family transcriptional regulator [Clostridiales bacterium]HBM79481.1 Rrf2 family transcriptional regulator [Clostridiaceae bacterium]